MGIYNADGVRCGQLDRPMRDGGGVYATDANKNVTAYFIIPEWPEQPNGTYFTYTPFGEPVNGAKRFAFSSEEWLGDYGLLRYLYRDYSPSLKRFLTRDPIGENGGTNLYNFVGNNPVTEQDILGFFDLSDLVDATENAYDSSCKTIGHIAVCVEDSIVKAVDAVFADDFYIIGSVTGPTGDIIGGIKNMVIGMKVKGGGRQTLNGVYRLGLYAVVDVASPIYGNTYGKIAAYCTTFNMSNPKWTDYVLPLVIPNFGNYAGANWGYDQMQKYNPFGGVNTKLELGSFWHDFNMDYANNPQCPAASDAHLGWIKRVYTAPGVEPGIVGQGYRAIGTVAFLVGSVVDTRNSK